MKTVLTATHAAESQHALTSWEEEMKLLNQRGTICLLVAVIGVSVAFIATRQSQKEVNHSPVALSSEQEDMARRWQVALNDYFKRPYREEPSTVFDKETLERSLGAGIMINDAWVKRFQNLRRKHRVEVTSIYSQKPGTVLYPALLVLVDGKFMTHFDLSADGREITRIGDLPKDVEPVP